MKKVVSLFGVGIVLIAIVCFSGKVNAMESYFKSSLVSLAAGQHHGIIMDDCPYRYHQGGALATVQPSDSVYIYWTFYKKTLLNRYAKKDYDVITNLTTSFWKSSKSVDYGSGDYAQQFDAVGGSYTGNVEALNSPVNNPKV